MRSSFLRQPLVNFSDDETHLQTVGNMFFRELGVLMYERSGSYGLEVKLKELTTAQLSKSSK
jgi:hypothetical protein